MLQRSPILYLGTADSTQTEARRRIFGACGSVLARTQTGGRGRRGRIWQSPPGNLYASLYVREAAPCLRSALFWGSVLLQAVPELPDLCLKWPNDPVTADGRKCGGILLEADADGAVCIGIGVNLVSAPSAAAVDLPAAVLPLPLSPFELWQRILQTADTYASECHHRPEAPVQYIAARAFGLGRRCTLDLPEGTQLTGRFIGLDPDGALRLETDAGVRSITVADRTRFETAP